MLVRSDKKKREGEGDLWIDPVIRSLDPVASKAPTLCKITPKSDRCGSDLHFVVVLDFFPPGRVSNRPRVVAHSASSTARNQLSLLVAAAEFVAQAPEEQHAQQLVNNSAPRRAV
jgi:hypothetical protein